MKTMKIWRNTLKTTISPSTTPCETRFSEKRGSLALGGRHGGKKTNSHPLGGRFLDGKSTSDGSRTLENSEKTASHATGYLANDAGRG